MLNLTLHKIYSDICYSSPEEQEDFRVLKCWCKKINKHWERELELSAIRQKEDLHYYIQKFVSYFSEKLRYRIDDLNEAKSFIDSLNIKLGDYTNKQLLTSAINAYNDQGSEQVDFIEWKASRIYGVVEAYLRHAHTDYDTWLKQMTRRVRDEGAYDYLKSAIRSQLESQYPDIYWDICSQQNNMRRELLRSGATPMPKLKYKCKVNIKTAS